MVAELMQEMNLTSIRNNAKKNYLKQGKERKKYRLQLNFSSTAPNQVWVSDITYFKLNGKTLYICAILDLYSRKAISYGISLKASTQLVTSSFWRAYLRRSTSGELLFHSDRGTQYISFFMQKLLNTCGVKQSFSPTARPCHNAVMESFFASMKKEELYRKNYHSLEKCKECVRKYIDFYNIERPHSTLSYMMSNAHETLYFARQEKHAK